MDSIYSCLFFLWFLKNHLKSSSVTEGDSPSTGVQCSMDRERAWSRQQRQSPYLQVIEQVMKRYRPWTKGQRECVGKLSRQLEDCGVDEGIKFFWSYTSVQTPTSSIPIGIVTSWSKPFNLLEPQFYNPYCSLPCKMMCAKDLAPCWPPVSIWSLAAWTGWKELMQQWQPGEHHSNDVPNCCQGALQD